LYIAEEQQILREAYQSFFLPHPSIEVVGTSGDTSIDALAAAAATFHPSVMLLGFKSLHPATVERLSKIREIQPGIGMVMLSASYDVKGIKALREFSRGAGTGCAYLLKHTIDTVDQLTQVVQSVSEGRIILDPAVMEGMISAIDPKSTFLKDLSPREMEVLSWMAKGYNNHTIADVLCLEPKTIERHINGIYNKLGTAPDSKHARVHAVTLYLRATGALPAEDFAEA
jgi:DNA-binding NarL/FixJ family response regulator